MPATRARLENKPCGSASWLPGPRSGFGWKQNSIPWAPLGPSALQAIATKTKAALLGARSPQLAPGEAFGVGSLEQILVSTRSTGLSHLSGCLHWLLEAFQGPKGHSERLSSFEAALDTGGTAASAPGQSSLSPFCQPSPQSKTGSPELQAGRLPGQGLVVLGKQSSVEAVLGN